MNPKTVNPYMHIELSADSEPEDNYKTAPETGDKEQKHKKPKVKLAKASKAKKSDVLIKSAKIIRNKLAIGDLISSSDEFERLLTEIAKMKKSIEVDGIPLSFLQILDHLNDSVVLNKSSVDFKKKKDLSKQLNLLKKKISATFATYEDEITEAKKSPDFFKEETLEEETGTDAATQQKDEQKADGADEESEQTEYEEESEEEQDELDFSKRLTLNKEERRKFWLLKPKDKKEQGKKVEKKRRVPKKHIDRTTKKFVDEDEEFKNIDLGVASVQRRLKDMYDKKMMYRDDELTEHYRLLNYIYDNVTDKKTKAETLILIVNFQLELVKAQGLIGLEFWEETLENIRRFFEYVQDKSLRMTNYIKGNDVEFEKQDLIRYFNGFVNQLDSEITYAIKLSDSFEADFSERISHEIDFVSFLFQVRAYYESELSAHIRAKYLIDISFKIIEHIYHISNDFVINSEKLSKLFESEEIASVVRRLANFVYTNCTDERLVAKMQLYEAFNRGLNLDNLDEASNLLHSAMHTTLLVKDRYLVALFNRALAVLGAAQFKLGNLEKCKYFLFELVNSENMESLLYQYNPNTTNVLDFTDPLCMFPYHMHINLQEVEAAFLLASILTESHKTVNFQDNLVRSVVNKKMIKFVENYQKNLFINSMNNIFDQIFICYRKIVQYDYKSAFNAVSKIKYLSNQDDYEEKIRERIKVECFNCYVEKLKSENRSVINIEDFSRVFDIEPAKFKKLLHAKIEEGDLHCSLDEKKGIMVVDNSLAGVLQNENDFELLETLRSFHDLNILLGNITFEKSNTRSDNANEVSHFIHRKFESQEKYFNFAYDYSYFKKLLG